MNVQGILIILQNISIEHVVLNLVMFFEHFIRLANGIRRKVVDCNDLWRTLCFAKETSSFSGGYVNVMF